MKFVNTYIEESPVSEETKTETKGLNPASKQVIDRYRRLLDEGADPNEWAFAWRTELNRGGFPAYELLEEEVIKPGKCVGCAACVSICPVDVFDYTDDRQDPKAGIRLGVQRSHTPPETDSCPRTTPP